MVSPGIRLRRLQADYECMMQMANDSDLIAFQSSGSPPDRYVVTFRCKGAVKQGSRVTYSEHHQTEITLHAEYPQAAPQLRQLTPIFHPNFRGEHICINAQDWSPRERLTDLVLRLGNMIVYANYNPASPLDGEAAQWARENKRRFPLDERGWLRNADDTIKVQSQRVEEDVLIEILPSGGIRHEDIDIRIL